MMGRSRYLFTLMLGLSAAACQSVPVVPALPPSAADAPPASGSWRATATDPDKERIRGWYASWDAALADARAKGRSSLSYIAYDWFRCRVAPEQGLSSLTKLTGSQRPVGLIFPDNLKRQIFLGTLELGDEKMAVNYGSDRMRDMAGLVERIGDNRWRLVLPAPAYESLVDVIELVPAS